MDPNVHCAKKVDKLYHSLNNRLNTEQLQNLTWNMLAVAKSTDMLDNGVSHCPKHFVA